MELKEYFDKNNIIIENNFRTKADIIEYLSEKASKKYALDTTYIYKKITEREKKLTTGIGGGLAIPHARIEGINDCKVLLLVNKKGVDFNSMDDKKVYIVALILSPKAKVKNHIALLSKISYYLTEENNINDIINANSKKEIIDKITIS